MILYLNAASPYARLVRVLLIESSLEDDTDLHFVDPWNATDELIDTNPAAKIPALRLDDGTCLIESSCIADYLVRRSEIPDLSPLAYPDATVRLEILGLGRAAMDCAFGAVIQERFAPASPLSERWLSALPRIARRLDVHYRDRTRPSVCDLGDLTVAVAFEYVSFRMPYVEWRGCARHLADRVSALAQRASLQRTVPE